MNVDAKIRVSDNLVKDLSAAEKRTKIKAAITKHPGLECLTVSLPTSNKGARAKGSGFENRLAKQLSEWFTRSRAAGVDEFVFVRRGASGGSKRDRAGDSGSGGDIMADKPEGKKLLDRYTFELKFHADLSGALWAFVSGTDDKKLREFWEQAKEQARPYSRNAILVLRTNFRDPIMFTDHPQLWQYMNGATGWISQTQYAGCFSLADFLATNSAEVLELPSTGLARMARKTFGR